MDKIVNLGARLAGKSTAYESRERLVTTVVRKIETWTTPARHSLHCRRY